MVWDKFAKQASNRALMNHLGRVGSDTGIVRQNLQNPSKNEGNRAFPTGWR